MKPIKTLRARFTIWLTALVFIFLVTLGGFVFFTLSRSLYAAVDEILLLSAEQVLNSQQIDSLVTAPDLEELTAFTQRGLTLILRSGDGTVLQAVGPFNQGPALVPQSPTLPEFQTLPETGDIDRIRVYTLPILKNDQAIGWVQTMQSLGNTEDSIDRLITPLILGIGMLSLLAGILGYFLAGRALAPIDEITNTARRISAEDLSARLNLPDTGDEISRLASTFDEMLARIESGFARERQFTADASHELRTPLTAMQTILGLVREGEWSTQEYRQALEDLSDETNRLQALVEELLQLARSESGPALHRVDIDLALLLTDVADSLRLLAENKNLALTCNPPQSLIISGDTDQLIRLFVNLLNNAIQYTEYGAIDVTAYEQNRYAVVEIIDTGIGIPPEHLPHIFDRFYRVDAARTSGGAGLGLSIAREIVLAHGGRLEVQSEAKHGTRFTIYLPK